MTDAKTFPRRACVLAGLLAAAAPCVPDAAAQTSVRREGLTQIPDRGSLAPFGLVRQWVAQAAFSPYSDSLSSVTADETTVYVVSKGGFVTAFDAETGGKRWSARLGSAERPVLEPSGNGRLVVFAVGRNLVGLDRKNGDRLWFLKLEALPSAGPTTDEQNVYVGFENGGVAAYNLLDVERLYNDGKLPEYSYNALRWNYRTSNSISGSPKSDGESVAFASRSGVYYSVTANSRQLRFLFEGAAPITAPFTRGGGVAVIPCEDLNTYCIDDTRGAVRWTLVTGLPVRKRPLVVGGRVFLSPDRSGTIAVSLEDGRRLWQQKRAAEVVATSGSRVFAKTGLGQMILLDVADGRVLADLPVRGFEAHVVNERTDRIFLATSRGTVLCVRDRDRVFPRFHQAPEDEPLLPEMSSEAGP